MDLGYAVYCDADRTFYDAPHRLSAGTEDTPERPAPSTSTPAARPPRGGSGTATATGSPSARSTPRCPPRAGRSTSRPRSTTPRRSSPRSGTTACRGRWPSSSYRAGTSSAPATPSTRTGAAAASSSPSTRRTTSSSGPSPASSANSSTGNPARTSSAICAGVPARSMCATAASPNGTATTNRASCAPPWRTPRGSSYPTAGTRPSTYPAGWSPRLPHPAHRGPHGHPHHRHPVPHREGPALLQRRRCLRRDGHPHR